MSINLVNGRYYVRYQGRIASDECLPVAIELVVSSSQGRQAVLTTNLGIPLA